MQELIKTARSDKTLRDIQKYRKQQQDLTKIIFKKLTKPANDNVRIKNVPE